MPYVLLLIAIGAEVIGTSLLRATDGFTRLWPTMGSLVAYGLAFYALARAIQQGLEVGIGYALWAGLGTTLIVLVGILAHGESLTWGKETGIGLIVAGVVVLNLSGSH